MQTFPGVLLQWAILFPEFHAIILMLIPRTVCAGTPMVVREDIVADSPSPYLAKIGIVSFSMLVDSQERYSYGDGW